MCCIEEDKEANVKTIFGIFLLRIILVFYILLPIYYNNYSSVKHEKPWVWQLLNVFLLCTQQPLIYSHLTAETCMSWLALIFKL